MSPSIDPNNLMVCSICAAVVHAPDYKGHEQWHQQMVERSTTGDQAASWGSTSTDQPAESDPAATGIPQASDPSGPRPGSPLPSESTDPTKP